MGNSSEGAYGRLRVRAQLEPGDGGAAEDNLDVSDLVLCLDQDDFQVTRGRWDSQAISPRADDPWPRTWPKQDGGGFDNARYCCFLTLESSQ